MPTYVCELGDRYSASSRTTGSTPVPKRLSGVSRGMKIILRQVRLLSPGNFNVLIDVAVARARMSFSRDFDSPVFYDHRATCDIYNYVTSARAGQSNNYNCEMFL